MSNIPTPHINAPEGAFADTLLMPGDPLRSQFIAENYLENPVLVNNLRGIQGYTGTYRGKRVSVMASGMGCPSISIYSYELFNFYGVKNIIRIGSAGAMTDKLGLGDIVVGMSAYTNTGITRSFGVDLNFAPGCSWELLSRTMENAKELDLKCQVVPGALFSSDDFYGEGSATKQLMKMGVLAVEMEAAALYINAAMSGKNALAICTISDSVVTGESMSGEERQVSFRNMMELGLSLV